jgi:hypothetical protein
MKYLGYRPCSRCHNGKREAFRIDFEYQQVDPAIGKSIGKQRIKKRCRTMRVVCGLMNKHVACQPSIFEGTGF